VQADLLVCDMNDHPIRVGEHLLPLLPKLKPGMALEGSTLEHACRLKQWRYTLTRVEEVSTHKGLLVQPRLCWLCSTLSNVTTAAGCAGGWLILTLKFYGRGREKASMVQHLNKYFQVRRQQLL
jgi:hypothetical protein